MTRNRLLITGGGGFIGTHIVRKLLSSNYDITILDNFNGQVHNTISKEFEIERNIEVVIGDVTDKKLMNKLLLNKNFIIHLAAETGTGQSMYQIEKYSNVNIIGTSIICDFLINQKHDIKKLLLLPQELFMVKVNIAA